MAKFEVKFKHAIEIYKLKLLKNKINKYNKDTEE